MDLESIKIPIEEYEKDIDAKISKEKKKEILDLLTNSNQLRSKDELNEIEDSLHDACKSGDVELIKILLSETIEDDLKDLKFKIDKTNQTASLFQYNGDDMNLIVPRTVKHESTDYLITSICGTNDDIETLKFVENSAVKTIYPPSIQFLDIKEIHIPASLNEIKENWCKGTPQLTKITISPLNGQFTIKDDKILLGKSDEKNDEFDILLFACRDIEKVSIPSEIKKISSSAFAECKKLKGIEIPLDSNLQIIGEGAFQFSNIEDIFIPSKVIKISESAFRKCRKLSKIEIPPDSNLQIIEDFAFESLDIKEIFIPSKVLKIPQNAFYQSRYLKKVVIPTNSNLNTIELRAFYQTSINEIYLPANLKELKEDWCYEVKQLAKMTISPLNNHFILKDDKVLFGKSDEKNDEFDILLFACRDIEKVSIPSNIKIISSNAFDYCKQLTKVEIQPNSNLQTIEKNAFKETKIREICIPSNVSKLCEYCLSHCDNLKKIGFQPNCNLQIIEQYAFRSSAFKSIFIPSSVSKIDAYAFYECDRLQIIEIAEESKLESFPFPSSFYINDQLIIMTPVSLEKLIQSGMRK